jgi:hypothetical protein
MTHSSPMTHSAADAVALEQIYTGLTPFFLDAAKGNEANARAAAEAMLAGFKPETTEQALLAAQAVVYGLAGMDSLRRSVAEPDLPVNTHLRLRGNATAMNRAAQQCRRALELRRRTAGASSAASGPALMRTFTEADLQAAIKSASAVIAEARSANPLASNRAVRRAAEREVRRLQRAA